MSAQVIPIPYPGIRPFEEKDAAIFFGRERQTNDLVYKLENRRFVAVVGSSGSGKSSLVKAGLIPFLRAGLLRDVSDWVCLVMRPGNDPFAALAEQIVRRAQGLGDDDEMGKGAPLEIELLAAELRTSNDGIAPSLERFNWAPGIHFLLIADQFEEIFGFRSTSQTTSSLRQDMERFVGLLLATANAPIQPPFLESESPPMRERIWAVLTMRSDFIGHCEVFPRLAEAVSSSQFLVPVLDDDQKMEAMQRPGSAPGGASYPAFRIDDDLVKIIVNDTGDLLDQLPLMQHALLRTWYVARERGEENTSLLLTLQDYSTAGRLELALDHHAESAWDKVRADVRLERITRLLFISLCEVAANGKLIRRRPTVAEVRKITDASIEDLSTILKAFQEEDRNFLLPSLIGNHPHALTDSDVLDISHEAILRQWRTFGKWQEAESLHLAELMRLKDQAALFSKGDGQLLAGSALERVLKWRKQATPGWASRYIPDEDWVGISNFVDKSYQEAKRIETERLAKLAHDKLINTRARFMALGFIVVSVTVGTWVYTVNRKAAILANQSKEEARIEKDGAEKARDEAENARDESKAARDELDRAKASLDENRVKNIVRLIGDSGSSLLPEEEAALWELAARPGLNSSVQHNLLEEWFKDMDSLRKPCEEGARGLLAFEGLSIDRHRETSARSEKLLSAILADPRMAWGSSDVLSACAERISIEDARKLARQATLKLQAAFAVADSNQIDLTDFDNLVQLLQVLLRRAKFDVDDLVFRDISGAYERLFEQQIQDSTRVEMLLDGAKELASINPGIAGRLIAKILARLEKIEPNEQELLITLEQQLLKFTSAMGNDPKSQESLDRMIAGTISKLIIKNRPRVALEIFMIDEKRFPALGEADSSTLLHMMMAMPDGAAQEPTMSASQFGAAMAVLLNVLDQAEFDACSKQLLDVFNRRIDGKEDIVSGDMGIEISDFAPLLVTSAKRLSSDKILVQSEMLASFLLKKHGYIYGGYDELDKALLAFAARLEPRQLGKMMDRLLVASKSVPIDDRRWYTIHEVLGGMIEMADVENGVVISRSLLAVLKSLPNNDPKVVDVTSNLAAALRRCDPTRSASISLEGAENLLKRLEMAEGRDNEGFLSLANGIGAVLGTVERKGASAIAVRAIDKILERMDRFQHVWVAPALVDLCAKTEFSLLADKAAELLRTIEQPAKPADTEQIELGDNSIMIAYTIMVTQMMNSSDFQSDLHERKLIGLLRKEQSMTIRGAIEEALIALIRKADSKRAPLIAAQAFLAELSGVLEEASGKENEESLPDLVWQSDLIALLPAEMREIRFWSLRSGQGYGFRSDAVKGVLQSLSLSDLVQVLKWPIWSRDERSALFSSIEAAASGRLAGAGLDDDVLKFIEIAPALGIHDLDAQPDRPGMKKALGEAKEWLKHNPFPEKQ